MTFMISGVLQQRAKSPPVANLINSPPLKVNPLSNEQMEWCHEVHQKASDIEIKATKDGR